MMYVFDANYLSPAYDVQGCIPQECYIVGGS
jgi:hypothetical protein